MVNSMDIVKAVILTQLFYAFAITILLYSMPVEDLSYVTAFSDVATEINLNNVSLQVQDTLTKQTQIPIVDMGALVLFSGNILLDLLVNFATAIPQMTTLLINGVIMLLNVDAELTLIIQSFATVSIMVIYFIGLLSLLTNVRSGGKVV